LGGLSGSTIKISASSVPITNERFLGYTPVYFDAILGNLVFSLTGTPGLGISTMFRNSVNWSDLAGPTGAYDEYRINRCRLRYVPQLVVTDAGVVSSDLNSPALMAYDPDLLSAPGPYSLTNLLGYTTCRTFHTCIPAEWEISIPQSSTGIWYDAQLSIAQLGLWLLSQFSTTLTSGGVTGVVFWEMEVSLRGRRG